jgi:flagellar hook-associated protein 2
MAGITLSGLSSGLDTNALIDGLMQVERAPRTKLTLKQTAVTARQDALRQVEDKLKALKLASSDLASIATWNPVQTATVSDPTKATAKVTAGAGPGTYSLDVTQLATAEQRTYTYSPKPAGQSYVLNGKTLAIAANESLDSIVSRVNADASFGVYAVNSGGQLVLASRTTGTASAISLTGGGANMLTEDVAKLRAAKDAMYTLDGTSYTSPSNTISSTSGATGFIFGVDISLQGLGPYSVTVSPPQVDQAAVSNKVKAFVDAYNAAVDLMTAKVTEKRVANPQTDADARKGALFSDNTVQAVMDSLRGRISNHMQAGNPTTYDELAEIGVSTGAATGDATFSQDAVKGKLTLDSAKLTAALSADPTSVQRLLGGITGTNGFSQAFSGALDPYSQAGGIFDQRIDSAGTELKGLADSLLRMDDRLARKQASLQKMFTALEVALQKSKSQGQELMAKLGVPNSSSY